MSGVKGAVDMAAQGGRVALDSVAKLRGIIALATLSLAGISAIGGAKSMSPSAVADNAGDFVINETLKTSLAKARQDNEALRRAKKLEASLIGRRLPHDKFI